MKWISFPAVWIVFLPSLLRMGDAVEAAPKIAVDERVHFYGVQYLDEVRSVSHTFYLTNEGDEPLTITGTHPSCGCTRADLSGQTIEPGGVQTLTAEFSFERYSGKDQIRVTIDSNDPDTPALDLGLQGFVLRKWKVDPPEIDFGVLNAASTSEPGVVVVTAQRRLEDPEPVIHQLLVNPQRTSLILTEENDRVVQGAYREKTWRYEIRALAGSEYSNYESEDIEFQTSPESAPSPSVNLKWKVEGDVEVTPRRLDLLKSKYFRSGGLVSGQHGHTGRIRVRSKSGFPIQIDRHTATPPFFVTVVPNATGQVFVEVGMETENPGDYSGILTLFTNHPKERQFDIILEGKVEIQKPILSTGGDFHHFGKVFSSRVPEVSHTFTLRNSGHDPLTLSLETNPGLEAHLADTEVMPGSSTSLFVRKDLRRLTGEISESVTLVSNDFARPRVEFKIQGEVLPKWRVTPEELEFTKTVAGKPVTGIAQVEEWFLSWERPTKVAPTASVPAGFELEIGEPEAAYSGLGFGTAKTEVQVRLNPAGNIGWNETTIPFESPQGLLAPIPPLKVRWELLGQMRSLPRRIVFSKNQISGGGDLSKDIKVYSLDESEFQVDRFEAPPGVVIEPIDANPKESFFSVRVIDPNLLSTQTEPRIVFFTNKRDEPSFEVEVLLR